MCTICLSMQVATNRVQKLSTADSSRGINFEEQDNNYHCTRDSYNRDDRTSHPGILHGTSLKSPMQTFFLRKKLCAVLTCTFCILL